MSQSATVVPIGEVETYYPKSKRTVRRNHKGEITYDSDKDKQKDK